MKKYFIIPILIAVLTGFSLTLIAQQDKQDRIEALKVAFITNRLNLSPSEAQTFWPVYNECSQKLENLRKDRRQQFVSVKDNVDNLSDKEVEALVDGEMVFRQKELDIQKEYHNQFKQVLPIKKVAKLYLAEEAFKRELLRRLQEQRK